MCKENTIHCILEQTSSWAIPYLFGYMTDVYPLKKQPQKSIFILRDGSRL